MVIEPPGDARRGRVLEVDDGVLIAGELALIEEGSGAMHQAVVVVGGGRRDALAVETREEGGGAGSIEALVVVEDPNLHVGALLLVEKANGWNC
jgi:hypothetical protein